MREIAEEIRRSADYKEDLARIEELVNDAAGAKEVFDTAVVNCPQKDTPGGHSHGALFLRE